MKPPEYDPAAPQQADRLPVGSAGTVRGYVRELARRHRRAFAVLIIVNTFASVCSMVGPFLLGGLVEDLAARSKAHRLQATAAGWWGPNGLHLERTIVLFVIALAAQTIFVRMTRLRGAMLGERMLADLREDFLVRSVALPPGVLERAGTGDLLSRITTDVDRLANAMREAVPQLSVAVVWAALLLGALAVTAPPLALTLLVALPVLLLAGRWYFRRAPSAYRSEAAGYAAVAAALAETVDAGRTVEAHRLGGHRVRMGDRRIGQWVAWERYTLSLRMVLFPMVNATHIIALASVLVIGGWFVLRGWITIGQLTTGALYVQMLTDPVNMILRWYDELQVAQVSLARLVGVREVPGETSGYEVTPSGRMVQADQVRFGYLKGSDVLHGVSLTVAPGTRMALVGPSGAGKSTLGRLLAGIYAPRAGELTLGGAALARMPAERVRRHVALVNQEHHVFVGSLRDNLLLARTDAGDGELWAALGSVDALEWAEGLQQGLDTDVGSGGVMLTPAQAQQIALARLVLADPRVLVLDEATSLLDPRAARQLERSLARVLDGRTVVAIAHRLHTAHDADLIAVVEDGRIVELGNHHDLVAENGAYAALWQSWHSNGDGEHHPMGRP